MKPVQNFNYGYTKNGNRYEKSTIGKKAGTILGAGAAIGTMSNMKLLKSIPMPYLKETLGDSKSVIDFIKNKPIVNVGDRLSQIVSDSVSSVDGKAKSLYSRFIDFAGTPKGGKLVKGTYIAALALTIFSFTKHIFGDCIDASINKVRKNKADKQAKELNSQL